MTYKKKPTVSIALAVFNGEKYIGEQLASFISQTRMPDEVIIFDDKSTDATVSLCERFQTVAPFHVGIYLNDRNVGVKRNFEKAIQKCSGDIIFLSDQDDVWRTNKIEKISNIFASKPTIVAITNNAIICDEALNPTKFTMLQQTLALGRSEGDVISGCCSAFRREFLEIALPIPQAAAAHDNWLNGLAKLFSARMICRDVLQYYRRHGSNESHDVSSKSEKLSRLTLVKEYGLRDSKSGWRDAISELQAYADHIRATDSGIRALGISVDPEAVVDALLSKIDALQRRLQIVEKPRWKRIAPILRNYMDGHYHRFHGLPSALKDIIRP